MEKHGVSPGFNQRIYTFLRSRMFDSELNATGHRATLRPPTGVPVSLCLPARKKACENLHSDYFSEFKAHSAFDGFVRGLEERLLKKMSVNLKIPTFSRLKNKVILCASAILALIGVAFLNKHREEYVNPLLVTVQWKDLNPKYPFSSGSSTWAAWMAILDNMTASIESIERDSEDTSNALKKVAAILLSHTEDSTMTGMEPPVMATSSNSRTIVKGGDGGIAHQKWASPKARIPSRIPVTDKQHTILKPVASVHHIVTVQTPHGSDYKTAASHVIQICAP
ncbi:unnamed protein product [Notodromas monacha]|uniref:Uncharacterized protein n=1 Tax=Notodromas monacha TaxID=399045 RepID=A0A7R9BZQ1_9CRUS|nr:unnamed protein product [Notodromas monacha]CAG0923554.1 unnamed protein product [Notodromas monacha]